MAFDTNTHIYYVLPDVSNLQPPTLPKFCCVQTKVIKLATKMHWQSKIWNSTVCWPSSVVEVATCWLGSGRTKPTKPFTNLFCYPVVAANVPISQRKQVWAIGFSLPVHPTQ